MNFRNIIFSCFSFLFVSLATAQPFIGPTYNATGFVSLNGDVYMCGLNKSTSVTAVGILGTNSTLYNILTPQKVVFSTPTTIRQVSLSSGQFSLALSCSKEVFAWGLNEAGEIGLDPNTTVYSNTPQKVLKGETTSSTAYLTGVAKVGNSLVQSFAVLENGDLVSWGKNALGELGNGTFINSYLPTYVKTKSNTKITNVIDIATADGVSFALVDADKDGVGTVYSWGKGSVKNVALGRKDTLNQFAMPVILANGMKLSGITKIVAGATHVLALDSLGNVWAWGLGTWSGSTGQGLLIDHADPRKVVGGATNKDFLKATDIAAGFNFSMAMLPDGKVVSWGVNNNQYGVLGNGGVGSSQITPVYVKLNASTELTDAISIKAGGGKGFVVRKDNSLWGWGYNYEGDLGNGTYNSVNYPSKLTINADFVLPDPLPKAQFYPNSALICSSPYTLKMNIPQIDSRFTVKWYLNSQLIKTNSSDSLVVSDFGKYSVEVSYKSTSATCGSYPIAKASFQLTKVERDFTLLSTPKYCAYPLNIDATSKDSINWYSQFDLVKPIMTTTGTINYKFTGTNPVPAALTFYVDETPKKGVVASGVTGLTISDRTTFNAKYLKISVKEDVFLDSISFVYDLGYSTKQFTGRILAFSAQDNCGNSKVNANILDTIAKGTLFTFSDKAFDFTNQNAVRQLKKTVPVKIQLKKEIDYFLGLENRNNLGQGGYFIDIDITNQNALKDNLAGQYLQILGSENFCELDIAKTVYYNLQFTTQNKCPKQAVVFTKDCVVTGKSNEFTDQTVFVYPNPTEDVLTVKGMIVSNLIVYTMTGQEILKSTENNISVSSLENGIYILKAFGGNQVLTKTFVKK